MDSSTELQRANAEISRLKAAAEIGKLLNSTLDLNKILQTILATAIEHLKADTGTVYLLDEEKKELWSKAVQAGNLVEVRLKYGQGIAGHVAESGKPVLTDNAYNDPHFNPDYDKQTGYHTQSMLCAPMVSREGKMVGVVQIINKVEGAFTEEDLFFLETISLNACIAIQNAQLHLLSLQNERINKEMQVAASILSVIIPEKIDAVKGLEISATSIACKEIGGDYYDVIRLKDNHIAFVIADVSGKGVPAALLVASLQASIRAYLEYYPGNLGISHRRENDINLRNLVLKLNDVIIKNSTAERFISGFIGIIDTDKNTLHFVNAGHNPPLFFKNGLMEKLISVGIPLGMCPFDAYEEKTVQLDPGDTLVLFTDGVTEAFDEKEDMYEDERLEALLAQKHTGTAEQIKQDILDDVSRFTKDIEPDDDITLMVIKVR